MNRSPRAVLFDWDGTLADTAEASYRCYVRMFEEFDIHFDRDVFARTYSPDWYLTFRAVGLGEEHWSAADSRWLAHFAAEHVEMIDGARELLDALLARGTVTGIVTSGSRERVMREIAHHRLESHIHESVFGDDVRQKKPDPEALLLCLERIGVGAGQAVFVGDSPEDVAMARSAGVYSIAVSGGYPNLAALEASGPNAFATSLRHVLEVIDAR